MDVIKDYLIFGNVDNRDYGIEIFFKDVDHIPKRVYERIEVPGRNGAVLIDEGRYEDVPVTYDCIALNDADRSEFVNALASQTGYQRMQDSFNNGEFYSAVFEGDVDPNVTSDREKSTFSIYFTRSAQRFLVSGEEPIDVSSGDVVTNPTLFESSPMLEVEGYGNIQFNGYEIELSSGDLGNVALAYSGTFLPPTGKTSYEYHIPINDNMLDVGDTFSMSLPYVGWHAYLKGWIYDYPFAGNSVTDTNSSATTSFDAGQQLPDRRYDTAGGAWHSNYTYKTVVGTISFEKGTAKTWTNTATTASTPVATKVGSTITRKNITLSFVTTVSYDGENSEIVINLAISRSDASVPLETQAYLLLDTKYSDVIGYSTVSQLGDPTYIDCDLGEAYLIKDGAPISLNQYIDLGSDLPKLGAGENEITFDNTVTSLKVVPHWWKV